jgi:hypothetical protein
MSMTTKAGGMSRHHNPIVAGREAAQQALQKADVDEPEFAFMFATIGYDQAIFRSYSSSISPATGASGQG